MSMLPRENNDLVNEIQAPDRIDVLGDVLVSRGSDQGHASPQGPSPEAPSCCTGIYGIS